MSYLISSAAKSDLENIWLYTADKWSVEQADRYLRQIFEEIDYLDNHPESGKDYSHIRKGYRRGRFKLHLIFYRTSTSPKKIEIIRVLHQSMDINKRLFDWE